MEYQVFGVMRAAGLIEFLPANLLSQKKIYTRSFVPVKWTLKDPALEMSKRGKGKPNNWGLTFDINNIC